jgi:hypothetical protein
MGCSGIRRGFSGEGRRPPVPEPLRDPCLSGGPGPSDRTCSRFVSKAPVDTIRVSSVQWLIARSDLSETPWRWFMKRDHQTQKGARDVQGIVTKGRMRHFSGPDSGRLAMRAPEGLTQLIINPHDRTPRFSSVLPSSPLPLPDIV